MNRTKGFARVQVGAGGARGAHGRQDLRGNEEEGGGDAVHRYPKRLWGGLFQRAGVQRVSAEPRLADDFISSDPRLRLA